MKKSEPLLTEGHALEQHATVDDITNCNESIRSDSENLFKYFQDAKDYFRFIKGQGCHGSKQ